MITDEEITKRQETYCRILDEMVQVMPLVPGRILINDVYNPIRERRSEKFCHDRFYEVDHGIIDFHAFEKQMRRRYGDHAIDTMAQVMAAMGGQ